MLLLTLFYICRNSVNLVQLLDPLVDTGKLDVLLSQVKNSSFGSFLYENFQTTRSWCLFGHRSRTNLCLSTHQFEYSLINFSFWHRAKNIFWCWVQIILLMGLTQVSSLWITVILVYWFFTSSISNDISICESCLSFVNPAYPIKFESYDNWAP